MQKLFWTCVVLLFVSAAVRGSLDEGSTASNAFDAVGPVLLVSVLVLGVFAIIESGKSEGAKRTARAEDREQKERRAAKAQKEAWTRENNRPIEAELISVEYRQSTLEGVGRAIFGDWLFGNVGAFVGAATTPERAKKATFRVTYATDRIGTETVAVGSSRFKELKSLLRDEEIESELI